jgi:hypothetical protein
MLRRRWHIVAWKLPLFVAVLLISNVLELASWITWHAYVATTTVRDRFEQWWRVFRRDLPSWWERPET